MSYDRWHVAQLAESGAWRENTHTTTTGPGHSHSHGHGHGHGDAVSPAAAVRYIHTESYLLLTMMLRVVAMLLKFVKL